MEPPQKCNLPKWKSRKMDSPEMEAQISKNVIARNGTSRNLQKWIPKSGSQNMDSKIWTSKSGIVKTQDSKIRIPKFRDPNFREPKSGLKNLDPQIWTPKSGPQNLWTPKSGLQPKSGPKNMRLQIMIIQNSESRTPQIPQNPEASEISNTLQSTPEHSRALPRALPRPI